MEEESVTVAWLERVVKQCSWLSDDDDYMTDSVELTDLLVEDAVPIGHNYSGRLLRLKATLIKNAAQRRPLSVILKQMPLNKDQQNFIADHGLFTMETQVYDEVLSKMELLMLNCGDKREIVWPKHFTISKENSLLLEDLKESGYFTVRQREVTYDEGRMVVNALGRYHAMSCILIKKGKIDVTDYQSNYMVESDTIVDFVYLSTLRAIIDSIRSAWDPEWVSTANLIESKIEKIGPAMKELVGHLRGCFDVLNHGDCWPNNIMVKHSSPSHNTSGIKLIDFQLCYYNSFAWDLVHFIYCSFLSEKRESYMPLLVSEYRRSLVDSLKLYGGEDVNVPDEAEMLLCLNKLKLFGIVLSLATIPRLVSGIHIKLDLDITHPDHAHKVKTSVYSMAEVRPHVAKDLVTLQNIMLTL